MALSTFFEALDNNRIEKVVISSDGKELLALDVDGNRNSVRILPGESTSILEKLRTKKVSFAVEPPQAQGSGNPFFAFSNVVGGLVNFLFPLFVINLLLNAAAAAGWGLAAWVVGAGPSTSARARASSRWSRTPA
jgi:ATP-dependent Zn protease